MVRWCIIMEINKKVSELQHLKEKILNIECNINTLKNIKEKFAFNIIKQKKAQLKQLKIEFQQVQQELHELLDKEMKL